MKVIQVITGLAMGGAEKVVVDLSIKSKQDHSVKFKIISLMDKLDRKPILDINEVPVTSLDVSKNAPSFINGIRKLRTILSKEKPDVIHTHMFHAYLMTILASMGMSYPVIFTGHSTNIGSKLREVILWLTKKFRMYDVIFHHDQHRYYNKSQLKTKVIENGIDISSFKRSQLGIPKEKTFTFLNVGNLEIEKNQLALIEIAQEIKKVKANFHIKIVGEGSKYAELRDAIIINNLQDTVFLLGKRLDVPELMASSHCYIQPSLWEGMPITILEAGISGIPIIATPVGNIPFILENKRGCLSKLENFADNMIRVMNDYESSLEDAQRLSNFIETNFSIDSVFTKHINLYMNVISNIK